MAERFNQNEHSRLVDPDGGVPDSIADVTAFVPSEYNEDYSLTGTVRELIRYIRVTGTFEDGHLNNGPLDSNGLARVEDVQFALKEFEAALDVLREKALPMSEPLDGWGMAAHYARLIDEFVAKSSGGPA
jgi:hypothetical protein